MADQEVVIVDEAGTEHVFPAGFDPKKAAAIVRSQATGQPPPATEPPPAPGSGLGTMASAFQTAKDVGIGVLKGAAHTGLDAASLGLTVAGPAYKQTYQPLVDRARNATAYTNTPQMLGGAAETAAELALPAVKGTQAAVDAIPTAAKAGAKFQSVMGAARTVPVDVSEAGNVALRIQQLAERGGSMPMAVRKFINRVTDPAKAPIEYEEARDFASNISRLSADEMKRLAPVVQGELVKLRVALNAANAKAAAAVGKGAQYAQAMNEYAKAKRLEGLWDAAVSGVKKTAPWAVPAGAAGSTAAYLTKKFFDLWGD